MNCSRCGRPLAAGRCDTCDGSAAPVAPNQPPRTRRRLPLRGLSGAQYPSSWKLIAGSLLGALAGTAALFMLLSSGAENKIRNDGLIDSEVVIPPGKDYAHIVVVAFPSSYSFSVKPIDGPAVMAIGRVDDGDDPHMNPGDLEAVMQHASRVERGMHGSRTGPLTRGRYLWVVANPSTSKPVRVLVSYW